MSNFVLNGEPEFWGSRLVWSATLDPGAFEMAAAGSTTDTIDCWRMTANDPSGIDASAHLQSQLTRELPHDVMPGDSYRARPTSTCPTATTTSCSPSTATTAARPTSSTCDPRTARWS